MLKSDQVLLCRWIYRNPLRRRRGIVHQPPIRVKRNRKYGIENCNLYTLSRGNPPQFILQEPLTLQVSPNQLGRIPEGVTLYEHRVLPEITTYCMYVNIREGYHKARPRGGTRNSLSGFSLSAGIRDALQFEVVNLNFLPFKFISKSS